MIYPDEIKSIEKRHLCIDCIREQFLKAMIDEHGEIEFCYYCEERRQAITIGALANKIHGAFERHFKRTATDPSDLEYSLSKEIGYDWQREGEPTIYAIAEAAQIDESAAVDVREVLEYHHKDRYLEEMGAEGPYYQEAHYTDREADDVGYRENWRNFENSLKTEARFFSGVAEVVLDSIFERLMELRSPEGKPVIVEAGPGTDLTVLYRARVFQAIDQLEEALKQPDIHIGPPPANLAKAGRMNAHGIAVFYGATESEIAISEVRPPVGSKVLVGRFELVSEIRLLDVSVLRSAYVKGSIFDPNYVIRLERAKFLRGLSERISRPVLPDDEPLEYLVTQAIADYLSGLSDPKIDGIVYPSVQDGSSGANVVLFHKASRVESIMLPPGTEVDVQSGFWTDDGWETDYCLSEEVLPLKLEDRGNIEVKEFNFASFANDKLPMANNNDQRETTLRLDSKSLTIHHVESVKYETEDYSVKHRRSEKGEFPPF